MLEYVQDQERKVQIEKQLEDYDRMLKLGIISKKEYEKEIHMLMVEVQDMNDRQDELNGCKNEVFDEMMGNPMEEIDKLIEEGKELFDKKVHEAIEEVDNERNS